MLRFLYHHTSKPTCSEMTETLNLNKSNRSYHLKILQEADLIDLTRQG
ncbi:helix-turn-helix domain-containing protein [Neobacillus pocheonensis]